jgi:hypothetical protein
VSERGGDVQFPSTSLSDSQVPSRPRQCSIYLIDHRCRRFPICVAGQGNVVGHLTKLEV